MAPEFPHLQSGPQFTKAQEGGAVRNGGKAGICYHHLPINKVLLIRKAWEGEETTRCLLALVGIKYNGCSAWTGPGMALPQQHPPPRPRITPTCLPRRLFQTAEGTGRAQWSSTLHLSLWMWVQRRESWSRHIPAQASERTKQPGHAFPVARFRSVLR